MDWAHQYLESCSLVSRNVALPGKHGVHGVIAEIEIPPEVKPSARSQLGPDLKVSVLDSSSLAALTTNVRQEGMMGRFSITYSEYV